MSAVVRLASPPRPRAAPGLDVFAMWRVQSGAVMLLAHAPAAIPSSGVVRLPSSAARGVFRALSWPGEAGGQTVLAAIRLADQADPAPGASLALHGAGAMAIALTLPNTVSGEAAFGQHIAHEAGLRGAAVTRFLLDTLRLPADRDVPAVSTMWRAFLSAAARADGAIEIAASVPGECVLLQGWGERVTGPVQVFLASAGLAGAALTCIAGHAGEFSRSDTPDGAVGTLLALPPAAAETLPGLDHVFVLAESGLFSRALVEHRTLDPAASLGHVRHMLPGLRCPPPMQALLREVLRPRFDGSDTLAGNARPVRAAVDCAVASAGAGAYVSGWMFDPARIITAVHLCGTGMAAERLDGHWTRIPRPDVTTAYREQPGFPAPPDDDAGFAAYAAHAPGPGAHLQFTFADGDRAFVPIALADPAEALVRRHVLASVDLYKPSGLPILQHQLAPLLARLRPAALPPARVALAGPVERAEAIVVALPPGCLPRAFFSAFLHDPATSSEQLVLACDAGWDEAGLEALRRLVGFYGLPATILVLGEPAGAAAALQAAAAATTATGFLVVGTGVAGRAPGWRQALRQAAGSAAFASPTLLYEDWSIRYAGLDGLGLDPSAPGRLAPGRLAGMPAGSVAGEAPVPAAAGTLECCLVRREALAVLDGPGVLATEGGREAALFLRLRAAGLAGAWVPAVQAYAPEEGGAPPGRQAGPLVDGWVLQAMGT